MTDVLIIEDDPHKSEELSLFVEDFFSEPHITSAVSVSEGISAVDLYRYDIVLLDMALPSHSLLPGRGPPTSLLSGGLEIIHEFHFTNRNDPIVILTQYPEIEIDGELVPLKLVAEKISNNFSVKLLGCVYYEMGSQVWREQLGRTLSLL